MEDLAQRLRQLRKEADLTQVALADALGIKRSRLSSYEQGNASPSLETLHQYCKYFNLDLNQLVYGPNSDSHNPPKVLAVTVDADNKENIELVDHKAAAGYCMGYADPEYVMELPKFNLPFLPVGTYRAFEITGDSMFPIPSGSIVIGQYVEGTHDIKPGYPYILITLNNGIIFKRVVEVHEDRLLLKSDNPTYRSYSLPLAELQEVWYAKLYISSDLTEPDNNWHRVESTLEALLEEVRKMK